MKKKAKKTNEEEVRNLIYKKLARVELILIEIKKLAKSLNIPTE